VYRLYAVWYGTVKRVKLSVYRQMPDHVSQDTNGIVCLYLTETLRLYTVCLATVTLATTAGAVCGLAVHCRVLLD